MNVNVIGTVHEEITVDIAKLGDLVLFPRACGWLKNNSDRLQTLHRFAALGKDLEYL